MIKDFIIQINSQAESLKLGQFLRSVNIRTNGYQMNAYSKNQVYHIKNNAVIGVFSSWSTINARLFQDLNELKTYFEQELNYEIY
jgi:hypothetical protein